MAAVHARVPRLLLLVAACLPLALACGKVTSTPFAIARIAVVAPLSGENAASGRDVLDAIDLAVGEWNARGGASGLQLEVVAVDEADPVRAARVLSSRSVIAAVGFVDPVANAATRALLSRSDAPPAVTLSRTTSPPPAGVLELAPTVDQIAEVAAAAVAYNLGPVTMTVVASGTAEDSAAADAFARFAPTRAVQIRNRFTLKAIETGYPETAVAVRGGGGALMYVSGHGYDAGSLWAELRARDSRARLVLGPGTFDRSFLDNAGGFFDGVVAIEFMTPPRDLPATLPFQRAFRSEAGRPATLTATRAYDAAGLLLTAASTAADQAQGRPAREGVRGALAAVTAYDGILRRYPFANGALATWKLAVYRLDRDGNAQLLGEPELQ